MAEVRNLFPVSSGSDESNDNHTIIWIDPGLTSGWAIWEDGEFFCSGQEGFVRLGELIENFAKYLGPDLWIGWEKYLVVRGGKSGTPKYSLETIGMLQWLSYYHGCTVLPSMPSSSRNLGGVLKLKRIGWYTPNKEHANDAASHLLAYLIKNKVFPKYLMDKILPGD